MPLALAASGLLLSADGPMPARNRQQPFDWIGFALIAISLSCFTYVFSLGSRWDWFQAARILWLSVIGAAALLAFLGQQVLARRQGLLDFSLFGSEDFSFAFIVSFVASAALFGSAFLIPAFALSVLDFTPTDAGLLLLPSGALFIGGLLISALLFQTRRVPPVATVPFGIMMIMLAMWMLSGSTSESGTHDMLAPILLRGFGLGLLFLSITLIAFSNLNSRNLACGIGLFNIGRQLGGLMGVAGLQTLIDHSVVASAVVQGANLSPGGERDHRTADGHCSHADGERDGRSGRWPSGGKPATPGRDRSVHGDCIRHGVPRCCTAICNRCTHAGRHQDRTVGIRESARCANPGVGLVL